LSDSVTNSTLIKETYIHAEKINVQQEISKRFLELGGKRFKKHEQMTVEMNSIENMVAELLAATF
jgi:hypothetical protein